jgi:hypothetical protein
MEAADPVTVKKKSELVWSCTPEIDTVPADEKESFPCMMTFGVRESQSNAQRLIPATSVIFSVLVPG